MTFEEWAKPILGDNPNWRESGAGELARQAYQAGRDSMKAEAVKVCEKWHDSLASEPEMLEIAEEIRGLK